MVQPCLTVWILFDSIGEFEQLDTLEAVYMEVTSDSEDNTPITSKPTGDHQETYYDVPLSH